MPRTFAAVVLLAALALLPPGKVLAGPPSGPSGKMAFDGFAQKRYTFTMQNRPLRDLIDWFADQTGLAFCGTYTPAGVCRFTSRPGTRYTLPEIVDIINEGLRTTWTSTPYLLVRGSQTFYFVPLDGPIDLRRFREVPIYELAEYGKTEFASVTIKLSEERAGDVARELERLSGQYGAVIHYEGLGRIRLIDTTYNLRKILRAYQRMQSSR